MPEKMAKISRKNRYFVDKFVYSSLVWQMRHATAIYET